MTTRPTTRRKAVAAVAMMLVTFSLGVGGAVFVAHPAAASSASTNSSSSKCATTTTTTSTTTTFPGGVDPNSPQGEFSVFNGTVNAASDHVIVGSSAFPNYTTGAVDNYYSMAKTHVDNSPFAEGTASPFDTGPIGQTAAAGNTQQPQYADARWPGDTCHAEYGNKGGPDASADASDYDATAQATEGSNGFAVPKGFDARLKAALAAWKAKWLGAKPAKPKVPKVTTPSVTVPTPVRTVTIPTVTVGGGLPTLPVKTPSAPSTPAPLVPTTPTAPAPSRTLSASAPSDGEWLLKSSTHSVLDPKRKEMMTSGTSTLGRVSIGGGQIVFKAIDVSAKITNDGTSPTPTYSADITVGSASIAGVPVTIDQDGVHLVKQKQALPYKQASDALNGALKQAGVQIFLVGAEVTSCGGGSGGSGTSTDTTSTTTTTTSTDQSSMSTGSCGGCDQSAGGTSSTSPTTTSSDPSSGMTTPSCGCPASDGGTGTSTTSTTTSTTTTSTDQSGMSSSGSCDQTGMSTTCGSSSSGTGTGTTTGSTTTSATPTVPTGGPSTTTTTTSTDQSGTSTTPSSCDTGGMPPTTGSCVGKSGTGGGTSPAPPPDSAPAPNPLDAGLANASEETVTATGVHVLFTQPAGAPSGVPAQFAEHILGEVFVDSLAAPPVPVPKVDLSAPSKSSPMSSSSSSCGGRKFKASKSGGGFGGGSSGSSAGGGTAATGGVSGVSASGSSAGSLPSGASALGSSGQPTSGSSGSSFPASVVKALRKPLWLLLAYLVWQLLVIGTGASLWHWRRGDQS